MRRVSLCLVLLFSIFGVISGQEVVVPNIVGLTVPQAVAVLNRAGLALGTETNIAWTAESGLAQNTISEQSFAAGQLVGPEASVDVTVLRSANAVLIYDDNDLSLLNRSGAPLNLNGITFSALDGNPATLNGSRWAQELRNTQCVQVWSVGRNGPKGLDECSAIQNWLVTNNVGEHFWTGANGTTQFAVFQGGLQRATCPVANPGRCEFYLESAGSGGETTEFIYFAYTTERLAIINTTDDQWMALGDFTLLNNNPGLAVQGGLPFPVNDVSIYKTRNMVANPNRLAPQQCLLFTLNTTEDKTPPQPCDVVGRFDGASDIIFWVAPFQFTSVTDNRQRTCPAAVPDRITLCVMPR
jgi:hypothetical protein